MAKMKLKNGCTGCNLPWHGPENREGQCNRCKRCLACCGLVRVRYSCAWRFDQRTAANPGYPKRSKDAYDRWCRNWNILSKNRRIF